MEQGLDSLGMGEVGTKAGADEFRVGRTGEIEGGEIEASCLSERPRAELQF
jgi:hypothetical protein